MTSPSVTTGLANSTGYSTFINSLLCPTDSAPVLVTVAGTLNATHNYNVNTGSGYPVVQIPVAPLTGTPNGPFFENSRTSPANFVDGMSNTVAVTETVRSIPGCDVRQQPAGRFPRHRRQRDHRSATQFGRRLCLAVPEPAVDDHAISGHAAECGGISGRRDTACTTTGGSPMIHSPIAAAACRTATAPTPSGAGCRSILRHEACIPEGSIPSWPTDTSSSSRIRST